MTKREFIMQFVLNRAKAGGISTDGVFWVIDAVRAWDQLEKATALPSWPPHNQSPTNV